MKRIAAIIATLAIYPAVAFTAQDGAIVQKAVVAPDAAKAPEVAKAPEAVGRIYVMSGNGVGQVTASERIVPGMLIKTDEKSIALLKFEDGQVVAMQSSTTFQVRDYHYDAMQIENSKIDFVFYEGGIRFVTGLIGQKKRLAFSLVTPSATIRGGETEFLTVKAGEQVYSKVLDGVVRITNSAGTATFKAGESPVVKSSLILASAFYTTMPDGIFRELLSMPVTPPLVVEAETSPAPAPAGPPETAPASSAESATTTLSAPASETVSALSVAEVPAPSPEVAPAVSPDVAPASAVAAVPAPSAESAPEPCPAPEAVTPLVPTAEMPSAPAPAQAAPTSCSCTCACK